VSGSLQIEREQVADSPHAQGLQRKIDDFNKEVTGRRDWVPVSFLLRNCGQAWWAASWETSGERGSMCV